MYDAISPLEFRYLTTPAAQPLRQYLSERAFCRYLLRVEAALIHCYAEEGLCPATAAADVDQAITQVTAEEVYQEEAKIHHQIRALVNCLKRYVQPETKPWLHLGATSHDIICTAEALRYKEATTELLLPALHDLLEALLALAEKYQSTLQIGRTHGQHAVPLTFGFAIAEYVSRLGGRIEKVSNTATNLRGQFSGAVGAYNAQTLLVPDPLALEQKLLGKLGLQPATHSTQIVEPEFLADFIHALTSTFGVLANLADDMRHLQRSEIGEVLEYVEQKQVGSSTMPHKRNPIDFEHVKSLWKTFMPRMMTIYMDQISEHQRDLSNSASSRFTPELCCGLYLATTRMTKAMSKLQVDKEGLQRNLDLARDKIIAEPLYILRARSGHSDSHEQMRSNFRDVSKADLAKLGLSEEEQRLVEGMPGSYIGKAVEKTQLVCEHWRGKLRSWRDIGKYQ